MAEKTYVNVQKFTVKAIFDSALKGVAVAAMTKAAEKAVDKSSTLTIKAPKEKDGQALYLGGTLETLQMVDKDGQKLLVCKVVMDAGEWDIKAKKGKMSLFPKGGGKVPVDKPDDSDRVAKDVAWLLDTVVTDMITKDLLKPLEAKAKGLAKAKK